MMPDPILLDGTTGKRITLSPPPQIGMAAPSLGGIIAPPAQPMLPAPAMPSVRLQTPSEARLGTDQQELTRLRDTGSGISQIQNPFGRTVARIGEGILTAVAPRFAALTPGTEAHHVMLEGQQQGRVTQDLAGEKEQAATTLLDSQPQLKQAALENQTLKTQGLITHQQDQAQHWQDQTDAAKDRAHLSYVANLRNHGYAPDEADPTGAKVRPLKYEEMSEQQQAVEDLKHAQQEKTEADAALKRAQNDPTSPAYRLAKQRVDNASHTASVASQKLGLDAQKFAFAQDKFYNPQPTATERTKGDLAQSAVERIGEMRGVIAKHPEYFGAGAGRGTKFKEWLGSQDPDAQTYLSANQYLADHSAAVFGGRSKYISQKLESLTDPHSNTGALSAALDEAERGAQGFVKAGAVHGKGGHSGYSGGSTPAAPAASGKAVSLKAAMGLPQNSGKSEADVRADIQAHGHLVTP